MVCWFGSSMVINASFINFSYIVAVSFSCGGNRRKPPTCRKSLTNFIKNVVLSTHHHERNSGSMLVVIGSDGIGR
jgi:hypothetical protein